jgi:hypothetical protein
MRGFIYNLRLLFSTRTRHYEIVAPRTDGGYIIYDGQMPPDYAYMEDLQ